MSEKAGHEAADQRPVRPGVEGLRGPGGLHPGGRRLPHAHGAASGDGAQSQASPLGVPAREHALAPVPASVSVCTVSSALPSQDVPWRVLLSTHLVGNANLLFFPEPAVNESFSWP